jgi:hypothetical protein
MCLSRIEWRRARKLLLPTSILVSVVVCASCSRTVVGGYADSSDGKYRVYDRIFGAYGRPFVDNTTKTIRISIVTSGDNERLLFRKEYRVVGSDISVNMIWDKEHNLKVDVYDYGPGVDAIDGRRNGSPTHHILTLSFSFDSNVGIFRQQTAK